MLRTIQKVFLSKLSEAAVAASPRSLPGACPSKPRPFRRLSETMAGDLGARATPIVRGNRSVARASSVSAWWVIPASCSPLSGTDPARIRRGTHSGRAPVGYRPRAAPAGTWRLWSVGVGDRQPIPRRLVERITYSRSSAAWRVSSRSCTVRPHRPARKRVGDAAILPARADRVRPVVRDHAVPGRFPSSAVAGHDPAGRAQRG